MLDFRQTNEPIYYNADQIQKTDNTQLQDVEQRHGELRQLEVTYFDPKLSKLLFSSRLILFNYMKFIVILLNLLVVTIK
jgi:hypothetical protein